MSAAVSTTSTEMSPYIINLTGRRFGRWTVLGLAGGQTTNVNGQRVAFWSVRCDCGTVRSVRGRTLRDGDSQSCGCLRYGILIDRFWSKVDKAGPVVVPALGPCWAWTGNVQSSGHGRMSVNGREERTHRIAFFLAEGHWPAQAILHRCDNPPCVRRDHLFEGTHLDNINDMVAKGRQAIGERNGGAKLSANDVRAIRESVGVRHADLAARFGVSRSLVGQILQRKIWTHLEGLK